MQKPALAKYVIDSKESTSFVSMAHIMEDLDHKHQITLKLSNTIATPYLWFASDPSHKGY